MRDSVTVLSCSVDARAGEMKGRWKGGIHCRWVDLLLVAWWFKRQQANGIHSGRSCFVYRQCGTKVTPKMSRGSSCFARSSSGEKGYCKLQPCWKVAWQWNKENTSLCSPDDDDDDGNEAEQTYLHKRQYSGTNSVPSCPGPDTLGARCPSKVMAFRTGVGSV